MKESFRTSTFHVFRLWLLLSPLPVSIPLNSRHLSWSREIYINVAYFTGFEIVTQCLWLKKSIIILKPQINVDPVNSCLVLLLSNNYSVQIVCWQFFSSNLYNSFLAQDMGPSVHVCVCVICGNCETIQLILYFDN